MIYHTYHTTYSEHLQMLITIGHYQPFNKKL